MTENSTWDQSLDYSLADRRSGNRVVLSGEMADDGGDGRFVLVRRQQSGFTRSVEFVPSRAGIAAINFPGLDGSTDDGADNTASIDYQLSVDPHEGCTVKCLVLSVLASNSLPPGSSLTFSWRGEGQAILNNGTGENQSDKERIPVYQGRALDISGLTGHSQWTIVVPTNSASVQLSFGDEGAQSALSKVAVVVDAKFSRRLGHSKVEMPVDADYRQNRLPPRQVLQLIEQAEKTIRKQELTELAAVENRKVESPDQDDTGIDGNLDDNWDGGENPGVIIVNSEKIGVFCGEDIILGTSGLFENSLANAASFVSINLPEWLFLDQSSGDIMGTVPVSGADDEPVAFTVYAVDGEGKSAKALIELECYEEQETAPGFHDHEVVETSPVHIDASEMFSGFGFDVEKLAFSATGLPDGLVIDARTGIITGASLSGTASDEPYEVVVTGGDSLAQGNGFGMRFLVTVAKAAQVSPSGDNLDILAAIDKLYQANRECEHILAANIASSPDEYAATRIASSARYAGEGELGDELKIEAFTPRRTIYLHLDQLADDPAREPVFSARLPGTENLPDWINFTPRGFASIECSPLRQFVDLEIDVSTPDGKTCTHDIRLDTYTGEVMGGNHRWLSSIEKQLAEAVAG